MSVLVMISGHMKSFQDCIKTKSPNVARAGLQRGTTIRVRTCSLLHPSIIPASSSDLGMERKKFLIKKAPNGPAMKGRVSPP